jgi:hypothetical protein
VDSGLTLANHLTSETWGGNTECKGGAIGTKSRSTTRETLHDRQKKNKDAGGRGRGYGECVEISLPISDRLHKRLANPT